MAASDRNTAQIEYWNGEVGHRWARLQDRLDGLFANVTTLALEAAALREGEQVLDIGCGCGATLLELARRVGLHGHVTGFDVSEPMLHVARSRIAAEGLFEAETLLADAASHSFDPVADLVFSRFGVMFFDAPAEAFGNLRTALKPGGRLAFVCWRAMEENDWVTVPLGAAGAYIDPESIAPPDAHAPGPFALADEGWLREILTSAGFTDIAIMPRDPMLRLAGPGAFDTAAALITQVGPVSRGLKSIDDARRIEADAAVAAALRAHDGPHGIALKAAIWVVTARA